jgi:hypothetical protein
MATGKINWPFMNDLLEGAGRGEPSLAGPAVDSHKEEAGFSPVANKTSVQN